MKRLTHYSKTQSKALLVLLFSFVALTGCDSIDQDTVPVASTDILGPAPNSGILPSQRHPAANGPMNGNVFTGGEALVQACEPNAIECEGGGGGGGGATCLVSDDGTEGGPLHIMETVVQTDGCQWVIVGFTGRVNHQDNFTDVTIFTRQVYANGTLGAIVSKSNGTAQDASIHPGVTLPDGYVATGFGMTQLNHDLCNIEITGRQYDPVTKRMFGVPFTESQGSACGGQGTPEASEDVAAKAPASNADRRVLTGIGARSFNSDITDVIAFAGVLN